MLVCVHQGSALHDVLERLLLNPPSRNWFKTSLLNLVLKHCHLQISDTNLQVQFPDLNDAVVFVYPYKQLKVKSSSFMEAIIVDRIVRKFKKSSSEMNYTNISSFTN